MVKHNHQLIARLQADIHKVLAPLVPASGKIALLDFPDHNNVGDSAIWLGEIEYFHRVHKIRPAYVCGCFDEPWGELKEAMPHGTIFLQGGGNLGDMWSAHHEFHLKLLEHFRNYKIVLLPSSLYFSSPDVLKQSAMVMNSHPDFTILVRDRNSFTIAKEAFTCRVELCPDMAFYLGALKKPVKPSYKLLLLMRTDKERVETAEAPTIPPGTLTADWLIDEPYIHKKVRWQTIMELIPQLGINALNKHRQRELRYRRLAEARLNRGLRLLSSAPFVITDRLHAHILCTLLDISHIALDNNYGKLSGFIEAWTKDCNIIRSQPSLTAALKLIEKERW